jgi:hypothetical protein
MIFFCRIFYFQQWWPSWLGAGSSDTILSLVPIGPMVSEENIKIQKDRKFDKKKSFKIFSSETNLANWDQTLVEWSLCGPLSESYPMTPHFLLLFLLFLIKCYNMK